jgi:hypothetical protein
LPPDSRYQSDSKYQNRFLLLPSVDYDWIWIKFEQVSLHITYGHFDVGLGFTSSSLHFLNFNGYLGPQRFLIETGMNLESYSLGILAVLALTLLLVVTGGIAYLTTVEWRDRRRQDQEKRENRRKR